VTDETDLRAAWDTGDLQRVATLAIARYGPEILGVLTARLRSTSQAADVFSMFAEDLWVGLPGFEWRCSFRAWAHRIARNAANRHVTAPAQRRDRNVPLSEASDVWAMAERVRTSTELHIRTEVKSEVRKLREQLSDEDQLLVVLRVDKGMEWRDLAAAISDSELDDASLGREAARLRKRFQLVKDKLRELARAAGLLPE
jgi:RNA polymerase sigma-70 factor (ECF subfamily)